MSEEYRFERISEERLGDFVALAKNAFGISYSIEQCRDIFGMGAWGKKYVGFLAYNTQTGEPAAFYGIYPCVAEIDGRQVLVAQSGHTMTHTGHRKKGLFYRLAGETFDLARQEGVAFVFGFPNASSYPGFMKLGWTHDGEMRSYHLLVPTFPLGHLAARFPGLRSINDRWFRFVTSFWRTNYRPFPSSAIESEFGGLVHDERFLDYKKEEATRIMIAVAGRTVWINQKDGSVGIGDIELGNGSQVPFRKIIRTLKLICFLAGSIDLRTYLSPGSRLDRFFDEQGYTARPGLANCYFPLAEDLPMGRFKYVYADYDTF